MNHARRIVALMLASLAAGGAAAAPTEQADLLDPRVLLQGVVTEEQVGMMFDYLRNALIAAAEGREGPVPELLRRELEKIDADVRLRGTLAGLLMLKSLEAEIRKLIRPPAASEPHTPQFSSATTRI